MVVLAEQLQGHESMGRRSAGSFLLAGSAAAVLAVGLTAAGCSVPQPTESSFPEQTATPTATIQPIPLPPATPTPTASPSALRLAPDFALPQAGGPDFSLAEQLAQGPVVIAFFQRGGG